MALVATSGNSKKKNTEVKTFKETKEAKETLSNALIELPLLALKGKKLDMGQVDEFSPIVVTDEGERGHAVYASLEGNLVKVMTPESDPKQLHRDGKSLYVYQAIVASIPENDGEYLMVILTDGPKPSK